MSVSKSIQKMFFFVIMAISAILLCFVGVFALQTNLLFKPQVSPDIFCAISANPPGSSKTTIFNNKPGSTETYISSGNTLSYTATIENSGISSPVRFELTNYTPTKHLRLSVTSIVVEGNQKNYDASVCVDQGEGTTGHMDVYVSGPSGATAAINLKVEEVYKVSLTGVGLAENAYYFGQTEFLQPPSPPTISVPLKAAVGYQLPATITSVSPATVTSYTRTTLTQGKVDVLVENLAKSTNLTVNCDQIFSIHKSQNANSMLALDTDKDNTIIINPQTKYLPNSGHYTYTQNPNEVVLENDFQEFPYYIELGLYPQTYVENATALGLNSQLGNLSGSVLWNYGSPAKNYYYDDTLEKWFLYEPIKWIVIGIEDLDSDPNNDKAISDLYFKTTENGGMLYYDQACGKPFSGKLVLMSAYVLFASDFDDPGQNADISASNVQTKLSATNWTIANGFSFNNLASQLLQTTSLSTVVQTNSGAETKNLSYNLFLLGEGDSNMTNNTENYLCRDFFKVYVDNLDPSNGISETSDSQTYNIGITSPTQYALQQQVKYDNINGQNDPSNISADRGWMLTDTDPVAYTSPYWTRSANFKAITSNGQVNKSATMVNIEGILKENDVATSNLGVRPCMILDFDFYYTKSPTQ